MTEPESGMPKTDKVQSVVPQTAEEKRIVAKEPFRDRPSAATAVEWDKALPGDETARFVEQLSASSAKKLVDGSGNKYRPVWPVKMLEMETPFCIHVEVALGGYLLKGERGDYLGLGPDETLFVVPRDEHEKVWKPAKR